MEAAGAGFRKELVNKLLLFHFKDDKTKGAVPESWAGVPTPPIPADTGSLTAPIPAEAAIRSVRQAQAEDLVRVDVEQLEKVLPQLLLDF
ncbi:centromere protein X isoform X1 [Sorex araneus]|uniref:centromere protein X isoform X1 n=1 Tax=Sorex araneus TaxID=42254 RepID=UPI002433AA9F|nr:centromere protein X isoform X1 [Sorex araneus]